MEEGTVRMLAGILSVYAEVEAQKVDAMRMASDNAAAIAANKNPPWRGEEFGYVSISIRELSKTLRNF